MIVIQNNPELSEKFRDEKLQSFFKEFLVKLSDSYSIKQFLIDGPEKTFEEQLGQLGKSFLPIKVSRIEKDVYMQVVRCIDGVKFRVGDVVLDKLSQNNKTYPISRMYADERGLHVQLAVNGQGTITWRNLSEIDQIVK